MPQPIGVVTGVPGRVPGQLSVRDACEVTEERLLSRGGESAGMVLSSSSEALATSESRLKELSWLSLTRIPAAVYSITTAAASICTRLKSGEMGTSRPAM